MLVSFLSGRPVESWFEQWMRILTQDWDVLWTAPVMGHWTFLPAVQQAAGYALIFALLVCYLWRITRRKNFLLWIGLYILTTAASAFSLVAGKYGASISGIDIWPSSGTDIVGYGAGIFFVVFLITAIMCHIFVKKTK